MYKDVSSVNKTKSSTKKSQGNYTYWIFYKDHGRRLALILLDTIVVIINQFTKMIQLKVTVTNISSEGIAKIYIDNI